MRRAAVAVLLLVTLAGCSGGGKGKDAAPDDGDRPSALQAVIGHSLSDGATNFTFDGPTLIVPEGANVSFSAGGTNASGARYAWDFSDGGGSAARNVTHRYATLGNHSVRLTVIVGSESANNTLGVRVERAGPPPPPPGQLLHTARFTFTGDLPLGNPNSPTTAGQDYNDHVVPINATTPNGTAVASAARLVLDGDGLPSNVLWLYWRDGAGTELAADDPQSPGSDRDIAYEASMPPGDYVARVRLFAGAQATYTLTVEVDYVTP